MINDNDLRWLAGVVDARGSISSYVRGGHRYIVLAIDDKDNRLIEELSKILGTRAVAQRGRDHFRRACARHCPENHVHSRMTLGDRVQVRGSRGYVVLWNLLPFLRVRRSEVLEKLSGVCLSDVSWGPTANALGRMAAEGWQIPDEGGE